MERAQHDLTHIPPRRWCEHCQLGKGTTEPERPRSRDEQGRGLSFVETDFMHGTCNFDSNSSRITLSGQVCYRFHLGVRVHMDNKPTIELFAYWAKLCRRIWLMQLSSRVLPGIALDTVKASGHTLHFLAYGWEQLQQQKAFIIPDR
eukprot:5099486-Amphidinium_carterae.1